MSVVLTLGGCKPNEPEVKTVSLAGTVERIERIDRDQSRVGIVFYSEKYGKEVTAEVIVTPQTEIFINGIAARLEDVKLGERAEGEAVMGRKEDQPIITVTRVRVERTTPRTPAGPGGGASPTDGPTPSRSGPADATPPPAGLDAR